MLVTLLCWFVYGLVVGSVAKFLHPGPDPKGLLHTVVVGIAGSYIGGLLSWLLFGVGGPFAASGLIFGVFGGVIFCWLYNRYLK